MEHSTHHSSWWRLVCRYLPALGALQGYRWPDARADVLAGVTVATIAVPQAMAYALVAGLPVQYGLYTAIVMTAVGALMASSRHVINGPTNAISIAVFSVIAVAVTVEAKIEAAILLAAMVGLIQMLIAMMRLGDLTRYISHSVIVGFTLGAGTLIILDQAKNLLGLKAQGDAHDHFLIRFWRTMTEGGDIHLLTLAVGLVTMVLIAALRYFKQRRGLLFFPEHLIALALVSAAGAALDISAQGVKLIGTIPAALPTLQWPVFDLALVRELAPGALAIAVLGLLEALSIAKAIAARSRQSLDTNQQCLSEGVANLAGSFFQCIPGSGSFTRSAVNHQVGAVSQWSGVVAAAAVALIMLFMAPLAQYIPRAALAGLLVLAVWRMADWPAVRYHVRATRFDAAIVMATALSAVAISIEFCVLIGIVMSFVLTVPRAGRMQRTEFVITEGGHIQERLQEDLPCCRVLIFGLEGELFFGASTALEHHLAHIEQRADEGVRVVVLRLKRLRNPDAVGLSVLAGFIERMKGRGIRVLLCGVRHNLFQTMQATGVDQLLDAKDIFLEQPVRETSTLLAVRYAFTLIGEPCTRCSQAKPSAQPYYFDV